MITRCINTFKTAAISINLEDNKRSYEEVMSIIKQKIDLTVYSIDGVTLKRSIGGNLVLQIPGENNKEKAEQLAAAIRAVLNDQAMKEAVDIRCPEKTKEFIIRGLDDAATKDEIKNALLEIEKVNERYLAIGEIKKSEGRLAAAWIKCPLPLAEKLSEK